MCMVSANGKPKRRKTFKQFLEGLRKRKAMLDSKGIELGIGPSRKYTKRILDLPKVDFEPEEDEIVKIKDKENE